MTCGDGKGAARIIATNKFATIQKIAIATNKFATSQKKLGLPQINLPLCEKSGLLPQILCQQPEKFILPMINVLCTT